MCRQPGFARLRGDGRRNHGGAVTVPGVVLDNQNRPDAALFAAHHRGEIGIVNIAALDTCIHKVHTPPKEVPVTESPSVRPLSFSHAGTEFILCQGRKIPASSPRIILCRKREGCEALRRNKLDGRRLTALRSQQVQAPLHHSAIFNIHPGHPAAHRAGQAPPRPARRGPRDLILVGQAEPGLPKVLPHTAERLDAASAAAHCPALTTGAGSAPPLCHLQYTPWAPGGSPRRSVRRGWCPGWLPGR